MYVLFGLAIVMTVMLFRISQKKLDIAATFPEVLRIPLMSAILGVKPVSRG